MDAHPESGFVPVPRAAFDRLLLSDARLSETRIALLVLRLTHGCRGRRWATLRPGDLLAVGIGSTHARDSLRRAVASGLVEQSGLKNEYRLSTVRPELAGAERRERLRALVGTHLARQDKNATEPDASLEEAPIAAPDIAATISPPMPSPTIPQPAAPGLSTHLRGETGAGRRWRFDREAKRFVRETALTAGTDLRQDAADVFGKGY